jgi:hypothetical protein
MTTRVKIESGTSREPLWYKDAVFYELRVRSFYDSNGDGVGDFPGLTQKLDYLQSLGVTTLWLLPFYPSPMRDDGYDIADYTEIHPDCGTLADFRSFLREAHHRISTNGSSGRGARRQAARIATTTYGAIVRSATRKRESSSRISSPQTGPGIASPRHTISIAFIPINPTSTTTTRQCDMRFCASFHSGWDLGWTVCGWMRCLTFTSAKARVARI